MAIHEPTTARHPSARAARSSLGRYHPGLDGLRGIAVGAVLCFHAGFGWAVGGYLGVSTFFTLSGFLITSLLLAEHARTGTISRRRFWERRARRLAPAALTALALAVVFTALVGDAHQVRTLPGDVLSALLYVANWHFILSGQSYLGLFTGPSPVQQFWSLAIEEQFYLLYPLVLGGILLVASRPKRALTTTLLFLTAASTLLTFVLYQPSADVSRVYYGTATRAAELLVGALLAVWALDRAPLQRRARRALAALGTVALVGTLWAYSTTQLNDGRLYHGGLLLMALASATIVLAVVQSVAPVDAILRWTPLRALGRISYGVYLYHWVVFLWLDRQRTGLSPWPLFGLRTMVTLAMAAASYHLIEQPVRTGRLVVRPRQWLVIPSVGALLAVAAFVVAAHPPADPLSNLATSDAATPPPSTPTTVDPNRPLRVLVIRDANGATALDDLMSWAKGNGKLEVADGGSFACGTHLTEISVEGTTRSLCSTWAHTWPDELASVRPDVVLLAVSSWDTDDALTAAGVDPADHTAASRWLLQHLGDATDLLTSTGARVVWAPLPLPPAKDAATAFAAFGDFYNAMDTLSGHRPDLEWLHVSDRLPAQPSASDAESLRAWQRQAGAALGGELAVIERRLPTDVSRIMVVGDSVARSLGYGLETWGRTTGHAAVWNTAVDNCGIAHGGDYLPLYSGPAPFPKKCDQLPDRWRSGVDRFHPDVVVLLSTIWDLSDRRMDGWKQFRHAGDPVYDQFLLEQYRDAVDILSSRGAVVVVMTIPCTDGGGSRLPFGAALNTSAFDPARTDALNQEVVRPLAREMSAVRLFDLATLVCPGGAFTDTYHGVTDFRPDGLHFSANGSTVLASQIGQRLLDLRS